MRTPMTTAQHIEDLERRLRMYQDAARMAFEDAEMWRTRADAFQAYICRNGWDLPDFAIATNLDPVYAMMAKPSPYDPEPPYLDQPTYPSTAKGKPW
jgi:hypothetical protein